MNITVYLGANEGNDPAFGEAAEELGKWIGENGNTLVFGGSESGLMGRLAKSALKAGGKVIGVEPRFFIDAGFQYDEITELIVTKDMAERKAKMIEKGDAFIAFPGGTGTLEEIAEVMSKVSLKQLAAPCILYNLNGYYNDLRSLLRHMTATGLSSAERQQGIFFADDLEQIKSYLEKLKKAPVKTMDTGTKKILEGVRSGDISVDEALLRLKCAPFEDIGFAKVDLHRGVRQGAAEVIYGAGKTTEQIRGIIAAMEKNGIERILITRLASAAAQELAACCRLTYSKEASLAWSGEFPSADGIGRVVVATGGTSDIPVAEEAALTAEFYGNAVTRLYDVGVAGLHRLLAHKNDIMDASVIVAVAGMEGALPSVVGGLADCPVIAVPTSVGYGASFGGMAALLAMLNSCASGVSVVNIDNGFGAGYLASMINHMEEKK